QAAGKDQMPGARDRQELRQSLDDAEHGGFEKEDQIHGVCQARAGTGGYAIEGESRERFDAHVCVNARRTCRRSCERARQSSTTYGTTTGREPSVRRKNRRTARRTSSVSSSISRTAAFGIAAMASTTARRSGSSSGSLPSPVTTPRIRN